ncbi:DUF6370 family protein [uncultured Polaribacter sp.]|uniref:DUF6370 family protein n=1 Tax=uncultured Polaribacter sp. TaxID=174711 RepID=UPI0026071F7D|nr:DUF6370 family protein [uncultured Polaribacter sp.]
MKKIIILNLLVFASCKTELKVSVKQAEISCGQCKFDLDSEDGCNLAVKFNEKAYFVDGFNIDDFGDAHDVNSGFCNVIRKGAIEGVIKDGRFIASAIELSK